jgi:aminopeptidase N
MTAPDPYLPHRGDASFDVHRYELELDYRPSTNALAGRATLQVEPVEQLESFALDLVGLGVDDVRVDGRRPARYRLREGRLVVTLAAPAAAGTALTVVVRYSGQPRPERGPWGEVGWEELTDGVIVAGQPDGAPTWFPCNDRPGSKASFRISVRTEFAYTVVANGALRERSVGGSRTTWVFEQDEPMAPYLATVQIGRYDEVVLADGPVPQLLVLPAALRERADVDFARSPEMVELFAQLFGPYPFSRYTVVVTEDDLEIPLEAQGISVFGANHVDGRGGSERLVAHELAHQWFGNSITVAAWRDIWLHEGFACYAEWLWSESSGGPSSDQLARQHWDQLNDLPQDLLLTDPGPELMFDDRLYKRGALALHAVRRRSGDDAFFDLLRRWVADRRHGTATTGDFLAHVDGSVGEEVGRLLREWIGRRPLPPLNG